MKNTTQKAMFSFLILGAITACFAQDNSVEFTLEKNQKLVNNIVTKKGNSAVVIWDKKNTQFLNYDSDLNLRYKKSLTTNFDDNSGFIGGGTRRFNEHYYLTLSDDGAFLNAKSDNTIIDINGEISSYNFGVSEMSNSLETYESGTLIPILKFHNSEYSCFIGQKLEVKKKKKRKSDTSKVKTYFLKKNHKDYNSEIIELPNFYAGEKGNYNIGLAVALENSFYTISKDLNDEKTLNNYKLFKYNYEGKLMSKTIIPVTLDNKFFMSSNNGGGQGIVKSYQPMNIGSPAVTKHELRQDATGNLHIDLENKVIYIYGLYTDKKDKDFYNANFGGFYIHKYSIKGDLLWKLQETIDDKKDFNREAVTYFMDVDFIKFKNDDIGFSISKSNTKQFAHFFTINETDGQISKSKKIKFEVDKVRMADMKKGMAFAAGHQMKEEFGKNYFDLISLFASYYSPKVNDYISSVKDKELNFNTSINEEGIYIIQENPKEKKYKLMKFNL